MTSLPGPPKTKSLPPRLRTSSSPFSPASSSVLSVPLSRPPLGQPGRSFEVKRAGKFTLIFRVPSHRASSSLEASACTLVASAIRRTAHPIRKVPTKAISCPWRTTTPSPSLHVSVATSTSKHDTQRAVAHLYGGLFTGVRGRVILRSSYFRRVPDYSNGRTTKARVYQVAAAITVKMPAMKTYTNLSYRLASLAEKAPNAPSQP